MLNESASNFKEACADYKKKFCEFLQKVLKLFLSHAIKTQVDLDTTQLNHLMRKMSKHSPFMTSTLKGSVRTENMYFIYFSLSCIREIQRH